MPRQLVTQVNRKCSFHLQTCEEWFGDLSAYPAWQSIEKRGAKLTPMPPVSKRSSRICWTASIAIRFASLVSIPRRAGRGTSRKASPVSCADAAPKRPAIFRHRWKNSLIATRANIALCSRA